MTIERNICSKCQSVMKEGIIVELTRSGRTASKWHPKPEKSFWMGIKLKRNQLQPINAFRCEKCGYLELYAHEQR